MYLRPLGFLGGSSFIVKREVTQIALAVTVLSRGSKCTVKGEITQIA